MLTRRAGVSTNAYTAFKEPGISFRCFGCYQLQNQEEAKKLASTVQQLCEEGRVRSTQMLVIHQWAGPSVKKSFGSRQRLVQRT